MITSQIGPSSAPSAIANLRAVSTANHTAVVTLPPIAERRYAIHQIAWSYSKDPTNGGNLTVTSGPNTLFDADITDKGFNKIDVFILGEVGAGLIVTLDKAGAGIIGKLNVSAIGVW